MKVRTNCIILLLTAFICLFTGCATTTQSTPGQEPSPLPENFVLPSRVAVLPFKNSTDHPDAATHVRRIFYNYFTSLNYRDSELYTIDQFFAEQNWLPLLATGAKLPWEMLCRELNIDGFITGTVNDFGKTYALLYSEAVVSVALQFRHCKDGSLIWEEQIQQTEREGDISFSPTGLAAALVTTYLRHTDMTELEVAAKLSMKATAAMPNPPSLLPVPPDIRVFVHNASGRLVQPGEHLKVVMFGDIGLQAFWSIPSIAERLPMQEKAPGTYIGEYLVKAGDNLQNAQLEGFLVSDQEVEARWIDVLDPVSIGQPKQLPNFIHSDTTLSAADGPYFLSGIVILKQGVQLTLLPGTTIWADSGAGVVVNGQLQALGTRQNPVQLKGNSDATWKGLTFNKAATKSHLEFVHIQQADIAINAFQSNVEGHDLVLEDNKWGVVSQGSELSIQKSLIRHSTKAALSARKSNINLLANTITENLAGGAQFESSQVLAVGNAIYNNSSWDIKNLDPELSLALGNNWWGVAESSEVKAVGSVNLEPLLTDKPTTYQSY